MAHKKNDCISSILQLQLILPIVFMLYGTGNAFVSICESYCPIRVVCKFGCAFGDCTHWREQAATYSLTIM